LCGYDIIPLLFLGGIGIIVYFIIEKKGVFSSFSMKHFTPAKTITFADIGGQVPAKLELQEALEFIVKSEEVGKMGIRPLKGILLTGPPGTGKTLLAKAAATYTDAVFLATTGSEFIEVYAGVGAQRVRSLFKQACELAIKQKKNKAIVFIDEIEILGGHRGSHRGHHEYDQTLNQLLVEMDGLKNNSDVKILVIGATNRLDMVDVALLRPGRFDRRVKVDLPDKQGRLHILKIHTCNKPLEPEVDLAIIAQDTFGFSGAHLESVANEAAILALREEAKTINQHHFKEAVDKVMLGEKLDRKPTAEEMFRIAVHEAGHAMVSEWIRPGSVSHLTITSRGNALGYTRQTPVDDMYLFTRQYLEDQIKICLGGVVAEEIVLCNRSTGAGSDVQQVIKISRQIIETGLSELGIVAVEELSGDLRFRTIGSIISRQEQEVQAFLVTYKELLEKLAQRLVQDESISGTDLREFLLCQRYCA
jgi:ATP-dependent metalloprotease FtsH